MFMNWAGAWSKKNAFYSFFFPSFFPSPSLSPLLIGSTVKYNNYPLSRILPLYTCAIKTHILLHWTGSNFYVVSTILISPAFVVVVDVVVFWLLLFCLILGCFKYTFKTWKFYPFKTIIYTARLTIKLEKLIMKYIKYTS